MTIRLGRATNVGTNTRRHVLRRRRGRRRFGTAVVVFALLSGCGSGEDAATTDGSGGTAPATTSTTAAEPTRMPITGVLLHADEVTMSLTAAGRNECGLVTTSELDVVESSTEVRIEAQERPVPTTTGQPGVVCLDVGGPRTVELETRLEQPLGDRTIIDAATGLAVRPVLASDQLVPTTAPSDWVTSDEWFNSTEDTADWTIRFGPANQPGMFYGVSLTMAWGYDCEAIAARFDAGATSTWTTVRGVDARLVDQPGVPQLSWSENGVCIQLMGFGYCTPSGCQAIDRDQLAALAESLAPATTS